jgi:hypothetical protein
MACASAVSTCPAQRRPKRRHKRDGDKHCRGFFKRVHKFLLQFNIFVGRDSFCRFCVFITINWQSLKKSAKER